VTAKALRSITGAMDQLRALHIDLLNEQSEDADVVKRCQIELNGVLGRIVRGATQSSEVVS
jgi:hypothetical protein